MIITLAPPQNITSIDLGVSSPKLGGVVNVTGFANLTTLIGDNNDITDFILSDANDQLTDIILDGNKLTGSGNQYMPPNVEVIQLSLNTLDEPLTDLSSFTQLRYIDCSFNFNMGGSPPLLPTSIIVCDLISSGMSGNIPSLNGLINLERFRLTYNSLTGTIPSVSGSPLLTNFQLHNNQLTGDIPDFSNCINMFIFDIDGNQLTGYVGGAVATTIFRLNWQNNLLTASAVNTILSECVAANVSGPNRIINVGGTGNAAPTGQGLIDKNTLISRSWSVTTN
tara:strand:+ start:2316 stop:3158 length:843 start_codon:yes stop_codon:yes gene_type:complete